MEIYNTVKLYRYHKIKYKHDKTLDMGKKAGTYS